MNELIAISALIGDRTYRIKIHHHHEEIVRKTLKKINEKILDFKTKFAGKDMQDYIAMVLIWYATEKHEETSASIDHKNLIENLVSIEKMLDQQLEKK